MLRVVQVLNSTDRYHESQPSSSARDSLDPNMSDCQPVLSCIDWKLTPRRPLAGPRNLCTFLNSFVRNTEILSRGLSL
jgi:hypothetical protein